MSVLSSKLTRYPLAQPASIHSEREKRIRLLASRKNGGLPRISHKRLLDLLWQVSMLRRIALRCVDASSSTGFSLCGLSCSPSTIHRLKPVLLDPADEKGAGGESGPVAFFRSIRRDRLEENLQAQLHRARPARPEHGIGAEYVRRRIPESKTRTRIGRRIGKTVVPARPSKYIGDIGVVE